VLTGASLKQVLSVAQDRLTSIPISPDHLNYPSASEASQYLTHQLLRDTDAAAMAQSLEVRTPLVDARLMAAAAACEPRHRLAQPKKRLLRGAAMHQLDDLLIGPKRGFRVPMSDWIRAGQLELSCAAGSFLDDRSVQARLRGARDGSEHWPRAWLLHTLSSYIELS
jgi:asparagine synthetase B (glutamine-hydrolysing)